MQSPNDCTLAIWRVKGSELKLTFRGQSECIASAPVSVRRPRELGSCEEFSVVLGHHRSKTLQTLFVDRESGNSHIQSKRSILWREEMFWLYAKLICLSEGNLGM